MYSGGVQGQLLEVNVVGGRNLRNTEWLSRQDPYVVIEYATNKFRTKTDTDGGKNPSFNEKFTFPLIEGLREFTVHVWNSNAVALDDHIGSGRVHLERVISSGYDDSSWPLTTRSGKSSGEIRMIMHYSQAKDKASKGGQYGAYPQHQQGYPPQQPGYPPQQPGYPPQQHGYPPQQHGYPPQQAGYPVPAGYPPQPSASHSGYPPSGYPPSGYPSQGYDGHKASVPYASPAPPLHAAPVPSGYPAAHGHGYEKDKHHGGYYGHAPAAMTHYGAGHYSHGKHKHGKFKHGKSKKHGFKGWKKIFK